jgi:hypothetical protein
MPASGSVLQGGCASRGAQSFAIKIESRKASSGIRLARSVTSASSLGHCPGLQLADMPADGPKSQRGFAESKGALLWESWVHNHPPAPNDPVMGRAKVSLRVPGESSRTHVRWPAGKEIAFSAT